MNVLFFKTEKAGIFQNDIENSRTT